MGLSSAGFHLWENDFHSETLSCFPKAPNDPIEKIIIILRKRTIGELVILLHVKFFYAWFLCPSLQSPPSVLKLEGWNFAEKLLILKPKKLPKFRQGAEIRGFFKARPSWASKHSLGDLYEKSECKISALFLQNWGRIERWRTDRCVLAEGSAFSTYKKCTST